MHEYTALIIGNAHDENREMYLQENMLETFDVDRLKTLIEKVVVYSGDAIEVVWKVRNPFDSEVSV